MNKNKLTAYLERNKSTGYLRIGFGLIWCINIWFHLHSQHLDHYLSQYQSAVTNGPHWLAGWLNSVIGMFQVIGPHAIAIIMLLIEILIAISLITGLLGRAGAWLGLVYSLFMFSTVNTLGAPFSIGYTDPGPWPPYIIAFIFIIESRAWRFPPRVLAGSDSNNEIARENRDQIILTRVLFGLLWAFEAFWKWHPYFIGHFLSYLTPAVKGQPAWIAAYISAIIASVKLIGANVIGIITAIVETFIALSLLSGRLLQYGIALGVIWSLGIWTTAEGWGGPYTAGFSSSPMPGDIFGNAINYALIFLFLAATYGVWHRGEKTNG